MKWKRLHLLNCLSPTTPPSINTCCPRLLSLPLSYQQHNLGVGKVGNPGSLTSKNLQKGDVPLRHLSRCADFGAWGISQKEFLKDRLNLETTYPPNHRELGFYARTGHQEAVHPTNPLEGPTVRPSAPALGMHERLGLPRKRGLKEPLPGSLASSQPSRALEVSNQPGQLDNHHPLGLPSSSGYHCKH